MIEKEKEKEWEPVFPEYCDDEECGCPCYDYCKDNMLGVDHFSCIEVYEAYKENNK